MDITFNENTDVALFMDGKFQAEFFKKGEGFHNVHKDNIQPLDIDYATVTVNGNDGIRKYIFPKNSVTIKSDKAECQHHRVISVDNQPLWHPDRTMEAASIQKDFEEGTRVIYDQEIYLSFHCLDCGEILSHRFNLVPQEGKLKYLFE